MGVEEDVGQMRSRARAKGGGFQANMVYGAAVGCMTHVARDTWPHGTNQ